MTLLAKYIFIFTLFLTSLSAQSPQEVTENYARSESLVAANWSVTARYVKSGENIIQLNSNKAVIPASGLKLFTTATALDALGPDFKFETSLALRGKLSADLFLGDLVIIGGGDPALGSSRIKGSLPLDSLMMHWVDMLAAQGIKSIQGDIVVNNAVYDEQNVPDFWYWQDLGNYYGAGSYALNLNDNLYHLFFKPGKIGSEAQILRTEPGIPNLQFVNYMKTGKRGSGDQGFIYCAPGQFSATTRGTIPAGVEEFNIKGSIPDPEILAAQLLRKKLIESGIAVLGQASVEQKKISTAHTKVFYTTYSPPLIEIINVINKISFNLYAEAIGKRAGLEKFGYGSNQNAVKAIMHFLEQEGISTDFIELNDVCGLAPSNLITSLAMADLLDKMSRHKYFDAYYQSMDLTSEESYFGSEWPEDSSAKDARVKSGYIKNVRSHSGYVYDKRNRLIVFSFIANNYKGSIRNINKIHKELIIALAALE